MKPDHERVTKLVIDTVTLLCKNGLIYMDELKIQGLLGITLDKNDIFIIEIGETCRGSGRQSRDGSGTPQPSSSSGREETSPASDGPPPRKRPTSRPQSADEIVDLTRLAETPAIRPPPVNPAGPTHTRPPPNRPPQLQNSAHNRDPNLRPRHPNQAQRPSAPQQFQQPQNPRSAAAMSALRRPSEGHNIAGEGHINFVGGRGGGPQAPVGADRLRHAHDLQRQDPRVARQRHQLAQLRAMADRMIRQPYNQPNAAAVGHLPGINPGMPRPAQYPVDMNAASASHMAAMQHERMIHHSQYNTAQQFHASSHIQHLSQLAARQSHPVSDPFHGAPAFGSNPMGPGYIQRQPGHPNGSYHDQFHHQYQQYYQQRPAGSSTYQYHVRMQQQQPLPALTMAQNDPTAATQAVPGDGNLPELPQIKRAPRVRPTVYNERINLCDDEDEGGTARGEGGEREESGGVGNAGDLNGAGTGTGAGTSQENGAVSRIVIQPDNTEGIEQCDVELFNCINQVTEAGGGVEYEQGSVITFDDISSMDNIQEILPTDDEYLGMATGQNLDFDYLEDGGGENGGVQPNMQQAGSDDGLGAGGSGLDDSGGNLPDGGGGVGGRENGRSREAVGGGGINNLDVLDGLELTQEESDLEQT